MIDLTFIQHYSPILVMVVAWILTYFALLKIGVTGPQWSLMLLGLFVALIFASSPEATSYVINLIPYVTVILVVSLLVILMLAFTGNFAMFQKPLAIIGFIIGILLILGFAFNQFPAMYHMLPTTSDSHLNHEMVDFKGWLYSQDVKDSLVFILSIALVGFFLLKK